MISFTDYKKDDGSVDWERYRVAQRAERQAEINAGRWCSRCGQYLLFAKGHPDKCYECRKIDEPGEVTHHKYIRCPKCGRSFDPSDADYYSVYADGEHEVTCGDCSHQFEISTRVSYEFTSPAKLTPEAPAESEE